MFKVNLPANPSKSDFVKAKADLHMQHLNKLGSAADRDQLAFGQLIVPSARKVTAKFRNMIRSLNETCMALHGEGCVSTAEMDAIEGID